MLPRPAASDHAPTPARKYCPSCLPRCRSACALARCLNAPLQSHPLCLAPQHPGNILVRLEEPVPGGLASRLGGLLGMELKLPRLVLLDVGMIAKLSSEDQQNLVGFFKVRFKL